MTMSKKIFLLAGALALASSTMHAAGCFKRLFSTSQTKQTPASKGKYKTYAVDKDGDNTDVLLWDDSPNKKAELDASLFNAFLITGWPANSIAEFLGLTYHTNYVFAVTSIGEVWVCMEGAIQHALEKDLETVLDKKSKHKATDFIAHLGKRTGTMSQGKSKPSLAPLSLTSQALAAIWGVKKNYIKPNVGDSSDFYEAEDIETVLTAALAYVSDPIMIIISDALAKEFFNRLKACCLSLPFYSSAFAAFIVSKSDTTDSKDQKL